MSWPELSRWAIRSLCSVAAFSCPVFPKCRRSSRSTAAVRCLPLGGRPGQVTRVGHAQHLQVRAVQLGTQLAARRKVRSVN